MDGSAGTMNYNIENRVAYVDEASPLEDIPVDQRSKQGVTRREQQCMISSNSMYRAVCRRIGQPDEYNAPRTDNGLSSILRAASYLYVCTSMKVRVHA